MCHNIQALYMLSISSVSINAISQFIQESLSKTEIGLYGEMFLQETTVLSVSGLSSPNIYWDSDAHATFVGGCAFYENICFVISDSNEASMPKFLCAKNGTRGGIYDRL